jgi:hypothetical protein
LKNQKKTKPFTLDTIGKRVVMIFKEKYNQTYFVLLTDGESEIDPGMEFLDSLKKMATNPTTMPGKEIKHLKFKQKVRTNINIQVFRTRIQFAHINDY